MLISRLFYPKLMNVKIFYPNPNLQYLRIFFWAFEASSLIESGLF